MADAENIVAADRVGPAKSRGVNSKGAPSSRSNDQSEDVFICGMPENSPCTICAQVSLTSTEQDIYHGGPHPLQENEEERLKEMKARKVKCRLDRDRLVATMFCAPDRLHMLFSSRS